MTHLAHTFCLLMEDVKEGRFSPAIIYDEEGPLEYASIPLTCLEGRGCRREGWSSISALLENYYASRDSRTRIRQKSADLRRIVQTALERNYKKYDLQLKLSLIHIYKNQSVHIGRIHVGAAYIGRFICYLSLDHDSQDFSHHFFTVFKRNLLLKLHDGIPALLLYLLGHLIGIGAVSYTHLDVYKRQG